MKKLGNDEIRALAVGAVSIEEDESGILHFYKYTKAQMDGFGKWNEKSPVLCTTGVRLDFHTSSSSLTFAAAFPGKYEVYIDGQLRYYLPVGPAEYGGRYAAHEEITLEVCDPLGNKAGEHRVTIYLPSHSIGGVSLLALDDGAYAKRHEFKTKFLMIGDSITQGWESKYDSLSYANRVSRFFDAESIVQGRGGSYFKAQTFEKLPDFEPDVVTVAYGVNDFAHYKTLEEMKEHLCAYLDKLGAAYGDKKVFVILPLWFKNREGKPMGRYEDCRALIANEARARGFICIDALAFVPPLEDFFTDGVHPSDLGFSLLAENLIKEMQKYL